MNLFFQFFKLKIRLLYIPYVYTTYIHFINISVVPEIFRVK